MREEIELCTAGTDYVGIFLFPGIKDRSRH